MIVAIIEPQDLGPIQEALLARGIHKFTVSHVVGQGSDLSKHEIYRGVAFDIKLLKKVRLEVAVNDEFVEPAIDAICGVAQKALSGAAPGKIFVLPIEQCVRIRTVETGSAAIG